jgi:hypothetical protein
MDEVVKSVLRSMFSVKQPQAKFIVGLLAVLMVF